MSQSISPTESAEFMVPAGKAAIVQMVQINQPFLRRQYLPYASGLLQAYVMRHAREPARFTFLPPLFEREPLEQALGKLGLADIVGLSVYIWNFRYSLALAQALKARRPEVRIVMGGPQVPDDPQAAEALLRAHPYIDILVHGEGEQPFLELLEAWPAKSQAPGLSLIDEAGKFLTTPKPPRLRDLDAIPSPYLLGIFDPLLQQRRGDQWVALWETNRGCPFKCSFCDWGSAIAGRVNRFGEARLLAEVEWFGRKGIHTIYCCDANFGMLTRDLSLTDAVVSAHTRLGWPRIFYTQSAKNASERTFEVQKRISLAGLNQAATLSLQSTTPEVLRHIQRENISLDSYRDLQQRFRAAGIETYTDILVGLPGESFASFIACLDQVIHEGQHHLIRFYNAALLPNAEMAQPAFRQRHGLKTVWLRHVEPMSPVRGPDAIYEYQEIVIATDSLPPQDWVRSRALAWWAELVYFNRKLLQLPIVLLQQAGLSYAEIFCWLLEGDWPDSPVLGGIRAFLIAKARGLQQGEPELCAARVPSRGEIWLTLEDHICSGLSQSGAWPSFFAEAEAVFAALLRRRGLSLPAGMLNEACVLSLAMSRAALDDHRFEIPLRHNLWQVYQGVLRGEPTPFGPWQGIAYRDWKGYPHLSVKLRPGTQAPLSLRG